MGLILFTTNPFHLFTDLATSVLVKSGGEADGVEVVDWAGADVEK